VKSTRLHVLVVEDDPDSRLLFGEVLGDSQIESRCVEPSQLPEPDSFGVVVTDLPGISGDGYSSARARDWIAQLQQRYAVPIVVVTARHEAQSDGALSLAADVMHKPIDIDDFVTRVRRAASLRRSAFDE
jgi:DNA-binding response OmpR family regulator